MVKTVARKPVKVSRTAKPRVSHNSAAPKKQTGFAWFGWLLVIIGLAALLVWQRTNIDTFINQVFSGTAAVFGWGLLLVVLGIIVSIAIFKREAVAVFARKTTFIYWYRWLGALTLVLAFWGMLGLGGSGGTVGLAIIGSDTGSGGWLRIIGLLFLSFVLLVPVAIKWLGGIISRPFRVPKQPPSTENSHPYPFAAEENRQPQLRPALAGDKFRLSRTKPPLPELATTIPASVLISGDSQPTAKLPAPEAGIVETKEDRANRNEGRDLKQVAQDVWRKYGETATMLTSDGWRLPPVDILDYTPEIEYGEADNQLRARMIEEALSSYGVESAVVQINAGPTVTQFGVEPGWDRRYKELKEKDKDGNTVTRQVETGRTRVKVDRISSLANDLALALAAPSIRIEAPIPGKSLVGIEVPNAMLGSVSMRTVIETTAFQKLKAKAPLSIALGKGAGGEAVVGDMAKMPHLLIAGAPVPVKRFALTPLSVAF